MELIELFFGSILQSLSDPRILTGNIVALLASAMLVVVGCCKKKRNALIAEIIESGFYAASDGILGGVSGVITNLAAIVRNLLCYFDKMNWPVKLLLCAVTLGVGAFVNTLGWIGVLPLFGTCVYICFMDTHDELKFKLIFAATMVPWLLFDLTIHSYVGVVCDALSFGGALLAAERIIRDRRRAARQNELTLAREEVES